MSGVTFIEGSWLCTGHLHGQAVSASRAELVYGSYGASAIVDSRFNQLLTVRITKMIIGIESRAAAIRADFHWSTVSFSFAGQVIQISC
jgi:hypothetical protein